jgi:hypothetical protein
MSPTPLSLMPLHDFVVKSQPLANASPSDLECLSGCLPSSRTKLGSGTEVVGEGGFCSANSIALGTLGGEESTGCGRGDRSMNLAGQCL